MKSNIAVLVAAAAGGFALLLAFSTPTPAAVDADGPVALRIELDRPVLPADSAERAIVKIALDGVRCPPRALRPRLNLALVIDRSGSMSGEKIRQARQAALEAVRQLAPDDIVALLAYDSSVETLIEARRVGDGRHLEAAICELEARGQTALHAGVVHGAREVRRSLERGYVNRIILLSDGQANVGPSSPVQLGRLGASLVREGISVSTIGLGLGFNEDLMTELAMRSDGNTYFVEDSSELPRIFAAELGDALSVVARRVAIEIEFPDGVRPLSFVGREGAIHGRKAEFTLNQLYGGQEKFALIEVEVMPGTADSEREIATARVSFEDAITQRPVWLTKTSRAQFSARSDVVLGSANHRVQADYAANVLAAAKDEAVALVDANRQDAAGQLLRARADELAKLATTYSNTAVQQLAAPAAAEASRIEREGLDVAQRKAYRAETAQTRNQQSSATQR